MTTNGYGFFCEEMIRDLLPEVGIPHKLDANGREEWFWWASRFEDHTLGIDCWLMLKGFGEVAVDFTVISERNRELLKQKVDRALERGVVPVVLEQRMLQQAYNGSQKALNEVDREIRVQTACKIKQLNGNRMTREKADQIKAKRRAAAA